MRFAEFREGAVLEAGPVTVDEAGVLAFARDFDPQWFHTDKAAAEQGSFGGLIASGWHTCAIAMRLAVDAFLAGSESYASPGVAYIKWLQPLRPGDSVRLHATVLEVRRSQSKPGLGILRWRWQLRRTDGVDIMELEATSLFALGDEAAPAA